MTGLDCNILVQLALADHPANAATVAVVQAEVQSGNRLVFPPLIINEFLHVITDARRFNPPLTMAEALDWAEKDSAAFLIALKDVVEAGGGVGKLAGRVGLKRPSLYKILSKKWNPTLETLQEILEPLGLRASVALDKAA